MLKVYKKIVGIYSDGLKTIPFPKMKENEFCVYILECCDKSFYIGFSSNLKKRLNKHNKGEGAEYTRKRRPLKLVYCEIFDHEIFAIKRERQLKGWSRRKKMDLICREL